MSVQEDMELCEENILNWGPIGVECPDCGIDHWIVDGDGFGKFWWLCSGVEDPGCCRTYSPEGGMSGGH